MNIARRECLGCHDVIIICQSTETMWWQHTTLTEPLSRFSSTSLSAPLICTKFVYQLVFLKEWISLLLTWSTLRASPIVWSLSQTTDRNCKSTCDPKWARWHQISRLSLVTWYVFVSTLKGSDIYPRLKCMFEHVLPGSNLHWDLLMSVPLFLFSQDAHQ